MISGDINRFKTVVSCVPYPLRTGTASLALMAIMWRRRSLSAVIPDLMEEAEEVRCHCEQLWYYAWAQENNDTEVGGKIRNEAHPFSFHIYI